MNPFTLKITAFINLFVFSLTINCFSQVIPTNGNPVGLEHNLLFNATSRFTVTQTGQAQVDLNALFDGAFSPTYSNLPVSPSNPTIITIEGLPAYHTQRGAWVGWTTRYWPSSKFKIEGYLVWSVSNGGEHWITITDQENYPGYDFLVGLPEGLYSKLKFTFYQGTGDGGKFGLSEIYFINTEATTPYGGLFTSFKNISEVNNNVLIGKTTQTNTAYKLDVAGKVRADEITVNTTGADFVFAPTYKLRTLAEVETFIKANKHLPDIAPAADMQTNGVSMGDMQAKLLQKVEELTLYVIEKDKEIAALKADKDKQLEMILEMKKEIEAIKIK